MFRSINRLVALLALAVTTVSFTGQARAQSRPFFETGAAQFAANQSDFTGGGHATHLGAYTEVGHVVFAPTANPAVFVGTGWTHYTAANGDVLCAAISGTVNFFTGEVNATLTYTGGSGRFTDASGVSVLVGSISPTGALTVQVVGTISY